MRTVVLLVLLTLARQAHAETEGTASLAADRMSGEAGDVPGRTDALLAGGIVSGAASVGLGIYANSQNLATAGGALAGGMIGFAAAREIGDAGGRFDAP